MKADYIPNLGIDTIDLNTASHIIAVGKTKSGKSSMINKLLCHHYVHVVPMANIYIMSPTFQTDQSYRRIRWAIKQNMEKQG